MMLTTLLWLLASTISSILAIKQAGYETNTPKAYSYHYQYHHESGDPGHQFRNFFVQPFVEAWPSPELPAMIPDIVTKDPFPNSIENHLGISNAFGNNGLTDFFNKIYQTALERTSHHNSLTKRDGFANSRHSVSNDQNLNSKIHSRVGNVLSRTAVANQNANKGGVGVVKGYTVETATHDSNSRQKNRRSGYQQSYSYSSENAVHNGQPKGSSHVSYKSWDSDTGKVNHYSWHSDDHGETEKVWTTDGDRNNKWNSHAQNNWQSSFQNQKPVSWNTAPRVVNYGDWNSNLPNGNSNKWNGASALINPDAGFGFGDNKPFSWNSQFGQNKYDDWESSFGQNGGSDWSYSKENENSRSSGPRNYNNSWSTSFGRKSSNEWNSNDQTNNGKQRSSNFRRNTNSKVEGSKENKWSNEFSTVQQDTLADIEKSVDSILKSFDRKQ